MHRIKRRTLQLAAPKTAVLTLLAAVALTGTARAADPGAPDYTRDVRPILAGFCFKCHGQDDKARKARLRLDVRDEAVQPMPSANPPIVPGKPDASELIARIVADEPTERMPPPATKMILGEEQKQVLK